MFQNILENFNNQKDIQETECDSFGEILIAFEKSWESHNKYLLKTTTEPKLIIVGGQPGSGKTSLRNLILKNNNILFFSRDEFIVFHPNINQIKKNTNTLVEKTSKFKLILAMLTVARCIDNKISFLLENNFADLSMINNITKNAKQNNYYVEINILNVPFDISWISGQYRMLKMRNNNQPIRKIRDNTYIKSIEGMRKIINQAKDDSLNYITNYDKLSTFTRDDIVKYSNNLLLKLIRLVLLMNIKDFNLFRVVHQAKKLKRGLNCKF